MDFNRDLIASHAEQAGQLINSIQSLCNSTDQSELTLHRTLKQIKLAADQAASETEMLLAALGFEAESHTDAYCLIPQMSAMAA